jgi:hypothetical protein
MMKKRMRIFPCRLGRRKKNRRYGKKNERMKE